MRWQRCINASLDANLAPIMHLCIFASKFSTPLELISFAFGIALELLLQVENIMDIQVWVRGHSSGDGSHTSAWWVGYPSWWGQCLEHSKSNCQRYEMGLENVWPRRWPFNTRKDISCDKTILGWKQQQHIFHWWIKQWMNELLEDYHSLNYTGGS